MKTFSRVISAAVLLALSAGACLLASRFPLLFALWYPKFSQTVLGAIGSVTAQVPFPLWEVLALALFIWAVYSLIRSLLKLKLLRWLSGLLWGVSLGVFLFVFLWGIGHFCPTKTEQVVEVKAYSAAQLAQAAAYYGSMAEQTRTAMDPLPEAYTDAVQAAFDSLSESHDCIPKAPLSVKTLLTAPVFSYTGTTGIFVPMTAEICVNPQSYNCSVPFTMCHEAAHRLGACGEADANFVAFLACQSSQQPQLQYSGYYSAFLYCYNALLAADPTAAQDIWSGLSPEVQADIQGASAHYEPFQGKVQDAAQSINDAYLHAMGQTEGVRSYGNVSDALVAWYQQQLWQAIADGSVQLP